MQETGNKEQTDSWEHHAPVHTICIGCVFAKYRGKTQTGCDLGRIDKYKEAGVSILEATNEDGENFFIIDERVCTAKRPPYWQRSAEKEGRDLSEQVYSEMKAAYHAIIILENNCLEDLQKSIESLKSQDPPPKHITVVKTQDCDAMSSDLRDLLSEHGIPWKLQVLTTRMHHSEAADLVLSAPLPSYRKNLQLYICIDSGYVVPDRLMEKLNHKINFEMLQFGMVEIEPDSHSVIAPISVHKFVGGNKLKEEYGEGKATLKEEIQKDEECNLPIMSIQEIL